MCFNTTDLTFDNCCTLVSTQVGSTCRNTWKCNQPIPTVRVSQRMPTFDVRRNASYWKHWLIDCLFILEGGGLRVSWLSNADNKYSIPVHMRISFLCSMKNTSDDAKLTQICGWRKDFDCNDKMMPDLHYIYEPLVELYQFNRGHSGFWSKLWSVLNDYKYHTMQHFSRESKTKDRVYTCHSRCGTISLNFPAQSL